MRIIISPAKKMNIDTDGLPPESLPQFLPEAAQLLRQLKAMSYPELKALWGCSDALAELNRSRLLHMDLHSQLTPAILSYEGIQYQYMAPAVFEYGQFDYVKEHLRILSGFYGLLRPFDGVVPYRLEMQARLAAGQSRNLYEFWGDKLCRQLCRESDFILNLASFEYSKIISAHLPKDVFFLTCGFGELKEGKLIEKGTLCKMARGEMVRFLAEHQMTQAEDIKAFDRLGYAYSEEHSSPDHYVFINTARRSI